MYFENIKQKLEKVKEDKMIMREIEKPSDIILEARVMLSERMLFSFLFFLMVNREPNENNPVLNRLVQAVKDMQKESEKGIKEASKKSTEESEKGTKNEPLKS